MPNIAFPENVVNVTTRTGLPSGSVYVYFDFKVFAECSRIDRVIMGPNRAAVQAYHDANPTPKPKKRFAGTSDLGFGDVIFVPDQGAPQIEEDVLFLITEKNEVPPSDPSAAEKLTIVKLETQLSRDEKDLFDRAQDSCSERQRSLKA